MSANFRGRGRGQKSRIQPRQFAQDILFLPDNYKVYFPENFPKRQKAMKAFIKLTFEFQRFLDIDPLAL